MTTTEAADAARELHAAEGFSGTTIPSVMGETVYNQWVDQIRSDPRYHLRDPDDPSDEGPTGSSGGNPMPALIVEYGEGPNDYITTTFDSGQVLVQDGSDPTGRAWKFPESAWRRFVAKVRGEELPEDEKEEGPTQHEAAADQNARTYGMLEHERKEGDTSATGVDEKRTASRSDSPKNTRSDRK